MGAESGLSASAVPLYPHRARECHALKLLEHPTPAPSRAGWRKKRTQKQAAYFPSRYYSRPENRKTENRELRAESCELPSKSHNVIPAIHVNHFAGDAAAGVGGEKDSSRTHFFHFHATAQWCAFFVALKHVAEAGNAARSKGFDRPGGK